MAIFQMKVGYISKNQKSTTKGKVGKNLSYISRATAHIRYIGRKGQYSKRNDLVFYEEKNIPTIFKDNTDLVRNLEKQSRDNARLFKKYQMSLPIEFDNEKNLEIAKEFLDKQFGDKYTYFWAMHNPNGTHPHIHISVIERRLDDDIERTRESFYKTYNYRNPKSGGLKVDKECEKREYFDELCETWRTTLNKHLILAGHKEIKPKEVKVLKEEEQKIFFSKNQIREMSAVEIKDILLKLENEKNKNKKEIKKIYQKNIDKEVINEISNNKLYKLENKIKGLNAFKLKKDITYEKKLSVIKQLKTLESEKEKLIISCKSNDKFDIIKKRVEREKKLKLNSINKRNKKIENSIKKIINTKDEITLEKVRDSLRKNINKKTDEYMIEKSKEKLEKIYKKQNQKQKINYDEWEAYNNKINNEYDDYKREEVRQKNKKKYSSKKDTPKSKNIKKEIVNSARVLGAIKSFKSIFTTGVKTQTVGSIISVNSNKRLKKILDNIKEIESQKSLQQDNVKNRSR